MSENFVSKPAIPFQLRDVHGKRHELADDKGHWLLLVFHHRAERT